MLSREGEEVIPCTFPIEVESGWLVERFVIESFLDWGEVTIIARGGQITNQYGEIVYPVLTCFDALRQRSWWKEVNDE